MWIMHARGIWQIKIIADKQYIHKDQSLYLNPLLITGTRDQRLAVLHNDPLDQQQASRPISNPLNNVCCELVLFWPRANSS